MEWRDTNCPTPDPARFPQVSRKKKSGVGWMSRYLTIAHASGQMRHVKTIWEKPVTQHSSACRSRDTLGQLPKTFWCGCWLQPTQPRATFVPGRRGTLPLGQLSMPSGDPGKWESTTEQRRMACYRSPPFPVLLPAPNSWGSRVTLFAEMWSRFVRGRGGGRTGSPGQPAKAGERARTSPGFESLSDAMVGCHEYISDPQDALSLQHRREQHR